MEAVIEAREKGKLRYIGFTGHKSLDIQSQNAGDGYLLHSPDPYRLWFLIGLSSWMKDLSQRNGLD